MKNPLLNWFTPDEQKVLIFLLVFGFLGLLLHDNSLNADSNRKSADSLKTALKKDFEIKYDLRKVTRKQLVTIPGIGPKKAAVILEYREKHGFESKRDLLNIKGIGEKTYAKYEKYFIDFGDSLSSAKKSDSVNPIRKKSDNNKKTDKKHTESAEKIDLNNADIKTLTTLKGIGPKRAEQIIALRKELGGFTSVEQILKVKGIGPKTLAKFRDKIYIGKQKSNKTD